MSNEQWKDIPGFPGYQASSTGRIRSIPRDVKVGRGAGYTMNFKSTRILSQEKTFVGKKIYYRVPLNNKKRMLVHRCVALAFHGLPPDGGSIARHLNDISTDNRPENIQWGTQKENMEDRRKSGEWENGHCSKTHCMYGHPLSGSNIRVLGGVKEFV